MLGDGLPSQVMAQGLLVARVVVRTRACRFISVNGVPCTAYLLFLLEVTEEPVDDRLGYVFGNCMLLLVVRVRPHVSMRARRLYPLLVEVLYGVPASLLFL